MDAVELAASAPRLYQFAGNPSYLFLPVIERDFGQERFLTEDPINQFQLGRFEHVPLMAGIIKNELAFVVKREITSFTCNNFYYFIHFHSAAIIENPESLQQLGDNFNELAPICFGYDSGTEQSRIASEVLRETFLPGPLRNDNGTFIGLLKVI